MPEYPEIVAWVGAKAGQAVGEVGEEGPGEEEAEEGIPEEGEAVLLPVAGQVGAESLPGVGRVEGLVWGLAFGLVGHGYLSGASWAGRACLGRGYCRRCLVVRQGAMRHALCVNASCVNGACGRRQGARVMRWAAFSAVHSPLAILIDIGGRVVYTYTSSWKTNY